MSGIAADVLLHAVYTEYVYRQGTTSSHHKKRRQQQQVQQMTNGTAPYVENPSSALPDIRTLGKVSKIPQCLLHFNNQYVQRSRS